LPFLTDWVSWQCYWSFEIVVRFWELVARADSHTRVISMRFVTKRLYREMAAADKTLKGLVLSTEQMKDSNRLLESHLDRFRTVLERKQQLKEKMAEAARVKAAKQAEEDARLEQELEGSIRQKSRFP
jgi:hypothetical protein